MGALSVHKCALHGCSANKQGDEQLRGWEQDARNIQQRPYSYRVGYASQQMWIVYFDTQKCEGDNCMRTP